MLKEPAYLIYVLDDTRMDDTQGDQDGGDLAISTTLLWAC